MMTDTDVIEAVRSRAQNAATRTDFSDIAPTEIAPGLSRATLVDVERRLGVTLHPLHRRLFEEIGNGGYGPGYGLLGLPGGFADDDGRSAVDLRECLELPDGVVPLADFGCGTWACLDESTGHVLTLHETGFADTGESLGAWLADWTRGVSLWDRMFDFEERGGIVNPFTQQPMTTRVLVKPRGTPYTKHAEQSADDITPPAAPVRRSA